MRNLDETIIIQAGAVAKSSSGEDTRTWSTWRTVRAKVKPVKAAAGAETFEAGRETGIAWYEVTVRRLLVLGVTQSDHRVIWQGQTLDIWSVPIVPRAEYLTLRCRLLV